MRSDVRTSSMSQRTIPSMSMGTRPASPIASSEASTASVSVDRPEASRRLKERLESHFTFLADRDGALLDAIGIRHRGGRNDGGDIAYPTAMLVDADGLVLAFARPRGLEIAAAIDRLRSLRMEQKREA